MSSGQGRDCCRHEGVCDCQRSSGVDHGLDRGDGDQGRGDIKTLQPCSSAFQGPVSRAQLLVQLYLRRRWKLHYMIIRKADAADSKTRWGLLEASLQKASEACMYFCIKCKQRGACDVIQDFERDT